MIYLSGKLKSEYIGLRPDIGVMVSFRPDRPASAAGVALENLGKGPFGIDNSCYKNPDINVELYLQWGSIFVPYKHNCLFMTAPDVVGDATETWERSEPVLPRIRELEFPAALVAQDGIEHRPIRWGSFDVLFIGGTTEWKLSEAAFRVAREAKQHGIPVHMGRVNSRRRIRIAAMALCDSADGTHFVFRPDKYLERMIAWLDEMRQQPFLNYEGEMMKVTHRLQVRAVCPVDGKPDVYDCRIVTNRMIKVERILELVKNYEDDKTYQETLCQLLANDLMCEVTLVGVHSGVKTEVTCEPDPDHFQGETDAMHSLQPTVEENRT